MLEIWHDEDVDEPNALCPRTIETMPLFIEGYTHGKNLDVRLNGIIFILESTIINGPRISAEQVQKLWDILITKTKLPGDQQAFFRFFRRILQERDWLDSRLVGQFFEEKIEQNHQIVNDISLDAFHCIQTMILYVNEFENYINIIKQPFEEKRGGGGAGGVQDAMLGSSSYQQKTGTASGSSSARRLKNSRAAGSLPSGVSPKNQQEVGKSRLEFRVHRHPSDLRGIEILWLIFINSPSRDLDLLQHVVQFLAQVYQSISRVLEDERAQIYADFFNESLRRLRDSLQDGDRAAIEKRDLVKNTMSMLGHSLADTEVNGSCAIRPHHNIDSSGAQFIQELTFQSFLPKEDRPKYF